MTIDGNKLRTLIENSTYSSIRKFAEAAGVHRNTVSAMVNGTLPNPNLDTINKIAAALKVDPQKFMMGGK